MRIHSRGALIHPSFRPSHRVRPEVAGPMTGSARAGIHNHRRCRRISDTPGLWIPGSRVARPGMTSRSRDASFLFPPHTSKASGGEGNAQHRSRGAFASEASSRQRRKNLCFQKIREAERREAHCSSNVRAPQTSLRSLRNPSASAARVSHFERCAAFRRSRLRHSPPAITPMAQLQNRVSRGFG